MAVQGDPKKRIGEVVTVPPGMTMPPENGFTPFWEKVRGLLYVPDSEVSGVDLSVGSFVEFFLRIQTLPDGDPINVAYDISNF